MALDFPSSPTEGQAYSGYRYLSGIWRKSPTGMALPKNYLVNPSAQISQENDITGGTVTGYYLADQWVLAKNAATGLATAGRVLSASANGSPYRMRLITSTAQASLAAAEYAGMVQNIEAQRLADLRWGTPNAIPAVLRFWAAQSPASTLTFTATLRNYPPTTSISFPFITSGSWTQITCPIPVEVAATWLTDNTRGAELWFTFASGANHNIGPEGAWRAGSAIGSPSQSNGLSSTSNQMLISDVGLYADPYATGVAPPYDIPDYIAELRACQRYWYRAYGLRGGAAATTQATRIGAPHPVQMRTPPAVATVGAPKVFDGATTPTLPAGTLGAWPTLNTLEVSYTLSGLIAQRPVMQYWDAAANYIAVSARM